MLDKKEIIKFFKQKGYRQQSRYLSRAPYVAWVKNVIVFEKKYTDLGVNVEVMLDTLQEYAFIFVGFKGETFCDPQELEVYYCAYNRALSDVHESGVKLWRTKN